MTDDSERDQARSQRPAPPYKRRPGDVWREELPPITRYLYDFKSEHPEPQFQPAEPVLESIEWKTPVVAAARTTPPERETGAWILEEWEQYDWRKAATLTADPDIVAAQHAWDDLDWDDDARGDAPGVTRTPGQRFRKPLLYPPELRGQLRSGII